jgi:hypothetical protein
MSEASAFTQALDSFSDSISCLFHFSERKTDIFATLDAICLQPGAAQKKADGNWSPAGGRCAHEVNRVLIELSFYSRKCPLLLGFAKNERVRSTRRISGVWHLSDFSRRLCCMSVWIIPRETAKGSVECHGYGKRLLHFSLVL